MSSLDFTVGLVNSLPSGTLPGTPEVDDTIIAAFSAARSDLAFTGVRAGDVLTVTAAKDGASVSREICVVQAAHNCVQACGEFLRALNKQFRA